jgi:hypothetical protein
MDETEYPQLSMENPKNNESRAALLNKKSELTSYLATIHTLLMMEKGHSSSERIMFRYKKCMFY